MINSQNSYLSEVQKLNELGTYGVIRFLSASSF